MAPNPRASSDPSTICVCPTSVAGWSSCSACSIGVSYAILLNTTDPVFVGDYVRTP
jgi:hypothetical protein